MAIPTFQDVMLPIMKFAEGVESRSVKESVEHIEKLYNLTDEEKQERVPSGRTRSVHNRVAWAFAHLKKAGLLESVHGKRGFYSLTEPGKKVLANNPQQIDMRTLSEHPGYYNFRGQGESVSETVLHDDIKNADKTPEEIMGTLSSQLDLQLADELLESIYNNSPTFFEFLVVDLLLKMGYGGLEGSGEVTKKSGDGGIDGVIKQDELGLDMIYIQAKRWDKDSTVSRPDIQKFAGALLGEGATKGVFITTASFAKPAVDYAKSVPNAKIILIDGLSLAKLMIKHDIGVGTSNIIRIKKIDSDYFEEQ
ncbi:MAG: restriction endonuclease [Defluviitaleaceae bacterium]|nr:restriction endonuclease [Defluviitaleaceae bacterium]MCL2238372.1 restriction endonuclease [Defluviitaleaceae bacterium]